MGRTWQALAIVIFLAGLSVIGLFALSEPARAPVPSEPEIIVNYQNAYPAEREIYETAYGFTGKAAEPVDGYVAAGIIPHHLLAADLIAEFFHKLTGTDYDTIILLGPNHFLAGQANIITSALDWQTPYGVLEHDSPALNDFLSAENLSFEVDEEAMRGEHSINSEVAFIKKTWPRANFLPLILKPTVNESQAEQLAEKLFEFSQGKRILVLASVDFSHYKTSEAAQADDRESIAALEDFAWPKVYGLEIDSPPAIYTLLKYAQLKQAGFSLLRNTNSAILSAQPDLSSTTSYVTGYFIQTQPSFRDKTNLVFVGDVMLSRYIGELMEKKNDWAWPFALSANYTSRADVLFGNLEGPISDRGSDTGSPYSFRADPRIMAGLNLAGFDVLSVANNHIGDWGRTAIADTFNYLKENNIAFAGGGFNTAEARTVKLIEVNGIKFGFLAYTPFAPRSFQATDDLSGISSFSLEKMTTDIKAARETADVVIVSLHFGDEYSSKPNINQQQLAQAAIEAGAKLVIGHHPHVAQEVEFYKDGYIAYSLGNFIFDQNFSEETMQGLLLKVTFTGREIESVEEVPVEINKDFQAVIKDN